MRPGGYDQLLAEIRPALKEFGYDQLLAEIRPASASPNAEDASSEGETANGAAQPGDGGQDETS